MAFFVAFLIFAQLHNFAVQETVLTVQSCRELYLAGDFQNARICLENVLEKTDKADPANRIPQAELSLMLGAVNERLEAPDKAEEWYRKAKELLNGAPAVVNGVDFTGLPVYTKVFQPTPPPVEKPVEPKPEADAYELEMQGAKELYFKGEYEAVRGKLDKLAAELAKIEGRDTLKGEMYLLMGANHEQLKYKEISIRYYCKAKEILGANKSFQGLELKKLKWYKKTCPAGSQYAKAGTKKKGGGWIGTLLGLALLGGAIWYLFINKNSPIKKKEKGQYTSITVKVDVVFKGLNSKGNRKLRINNETKVEEDYVMTQNAFANATCAQAQLDKSYSFDITTTGNTIHIVQDYLNWDFYNFISPGTNYKMLCTEWSFSVQSYTYESGKADPGTPHPTNTNDLNLDYNNDCTEVSFRVDNCTTDVTLNFAAPTSTSAQAPKVYKAQQVKVKVSK